METQRRNAMLSLALAASLTSFGSGPGLAQDELPWLQALRYQIGEKHNCTVNYFLNAHSYTLGDEEVFEARVICMDGRQFDASRTGEIEPFAIKSCEPVVC